MIALTARVCFFKLWISIFPPNAGAGMPYSNVTDYLLCKEGSVPLPHCQSDTVRGPDMLRVIHMNVAVY